LPDCGFCTSNFEATTAVRTGASVDDQSGPVADCVATLAERIGGIDILHQPPEAVIVTGHTVPGVVAVWACVRETRIAAPASAVMATTAAISLREYRNIEISCSKALAIISSAPAARSIFQNDITCKTTITSLQRRKKLVQPKSKELG
jgi:hypothetical protein